MTDPMETWKNAGNGLIYVIKTDRFGGETHELIHAGKSFSITKQERQLNMDRAATTAQDLFKNGTLIPVRLLDGDEEAAEFAANPNLMGESDMADLFKGHWKTFESKIAAISNEVTLRRLLDVAEKVDATVRQVKVITERLDEVSPSLYSDIDTRVVSGTPSMEPEEVTGSAVTPK